MHSIINSLKDLKASRGEKIITYRGTKIKYSAGFLSETIQTLRLWNEHFKILNEKNCQLKCYIQLTYYSKIRVK